MEINERIRKRRKLLGLTLRQVADKMGVSESLISRYESKDVKNMGIDKLVPLAEILGVTPSYLMGWEDEIEESEADHYYLNPETRKLAQEVYENPNLRILFDAARDVEPEDIQMAVDMLERFKKTRY